MQALFHLFLAPWWVFVTLATGTYFLGDFTYQNEIKERAELIAAGEADMPAAIDLSTFDPSRDVHLAGEVNITGWADADMNYHLTKTKSGSISDERFMYLLLGANDTREDGVVRAIMMLTKGQKEKFSEGILNHFDMSRDMNESGLGLQFNGFYRKSDSFGSMADDAIKELGMTKSPEVFYIDPFFDGRAIALKPSGNVEDTRDFLRNVASFLALVAGLKILMKTIKSRSAGGYQESENIYGVSPVSRTPHVKMPAESTRSTIRNLEPQTSHDFSQTDLKNDPIARMKQRAAVQHVASAPIAPMPREGIVEKLSGLSGQSKLTAGVLVLGIILLFTQPSLLGAFIPLGITLWVYLRLAGAVSSSVGGLFSELGLSKSRARSDPFDRL